MNERMREYWVRIISAWVLLLLANRIAKGAERMMRDTMTEQVVDTVESAESNGTVAAAETESEESPEVTA